MLGRGRLGSHDPPNPRLAYRVLVERVVRTLSPCALFRGLCKSTTLSSLGFVGRMDSAQSQEPRMWDKEAICRVAGKAAKGCELHPLHPCHSCGFLPPYGRAFCFFLILLRDHFTSGSSYSTVQ